MGLFDKIFEKKECAVCGGEIGLLGNRKLEDGNLCKQCAKKLSPFFSDRRHSTVEEIKTQLAYREENQRQLANFHPTLTYGHNGRKVYVDMAQNKFIVTRSSSWRDENPDIIEFSQVTACDTDIKEHKRELYYRDKEGQNRSYHPPRYEYDYEFEATIRVNSPWFDEINVELSEGNRPDSVHNMPYRDLEQQLYDMASVLMGRGSTRGGFSATQQPMHQMNHPMYQPMQQPMHQMNQPMHQPMHSAPQYAAAVTGGMWTCSCGATNSGKFCQNCGSTQPMQRDFVCDKCGWRPQPGQSFPRFCPNCGDPFDQNDMR